MRITNCSLSINKLCHPIVKIICVKIILIFLIPILISNIPNINASSIVSTNITKSFVYLIYVNNKLVYSLFKISLGQYFVSKKFIIHLNCYIFTFSYYKS